MKQPIRKPTLDEWFLIYQLKKLKNHFHLPVFVDVDVTRVTNFYAEQGFPTPYTTILIKAAGLWLKRSPEINKAIFHTFYGLRVVEFPYISVNIPVTMNRDGKKVVSATAIKDPHKLTHTEIRRELKKTTKKPISDLPINRIIHGESNNFISRFKLRVIHFLMSNFPKFYLSHEAGGVSVSSIPYQQSTKSPLQGVSYGLNGATIFNCSTKKDGDRTYLRLGIGYDHMICHGDVAMKASTELCSILESDDDETLNLLTR